MLGLGSQLLILANTLSIKHPTLYLRQLLHTACSPSFHLFSPFLLLINAHREYRSFAVARHITSVPSEAIDPQRQLQCRGILTPSHIFFSNHVA